MTFESSSMPSNAQLKLILLIKTALTCLAGFLLAFYLITGLVVSERPHLGDFFKFYMSGQRLLAGERVYWELPSSLSESNPCTVRNISRLEVMLKSEHERSDAEVMRCLHPNLNTPVLAMIMAPLTLTDFKTAWWIWSACSLLCALASLLLLYRHALPGPGNVMSFLLLVIAFFGYAPNLINYLSGQLTSYLLLPLTLAWLYNRRGQELHCGAILGLVASLKLFFGLFLILFLLGRHWRAATAFSIACGSSFLIALLALGGQHFHDYLNAIRHVTWHGASWNASFHGFFTRLLGGGETPPLLNTALHSSTVVWVITGGMLMALMAATHRLNRLHHQPRADLLFALAIPAMLLLSPLGWVYYFPLLIISLLMLWRYSQKSVHKYPYRLLLLLAVAMTALPRSLQPASIRGSLQEVMLDAALPTYALILIMLTGLAILFGQPSKSTVASNSL